jgi:hypothetical protein
VFKKKKEEEKKPQMTSHGRFIDDNVKVCKLKTLESNDLSRTSVASDAPSIFFQQENAEACAFCSHQQTISIVCAIFEH